MRIWTGEIRFPTRASRELVDITERVETCVRESGVARGTRARTLPTTQAPVATKNAPTPARPRKLRRDTLGLRARASLDSLLSFMSLAPGSRIVPS